AILCPVGLAAIAVAAPVSARVSGVLSADSVSVQRQVRRGRLLLAATLAGIAVMLAGSSAALASSGGWYSWGLIAVTAIAASSQARRHRFSAEVVPLLAVGLTGLLLLEGPLVVH